VFRILKRFLSVTHKKFFQSSNTCRHGFSYNLFKPQVWLDVRKYFFSVRATDAWYSLTEELLQYRMVENFKIKNWSFKQAMFIILTKLYFCSVSRADF